MNFKLVKRTPKRIQTKRTHLIFSSFLSDKVFQPKRIFYNLLSRTNTQSGTTGNIRTVRVIKVLLKNNKICDCIDLHTSHNC